MIDISHLTYRYESMLMDFTLHVPKRSLTSIIGPSGGGKSTLLNLIAGFERPLSGSLAIAGQDMLPLEPGKRPVNMIFQDHNSFAHLDVWTNVALGISPALRLTAADSAAVEDALERTGIGQYAKRKPGEISGGERQRIAIARALVRNKPVLLLDEPFAALGPALRQDMLVLIRELQQEKDLTILMVTHDPGDARQFADRTAFLANGRIETYLPTDEMFRSRDVPGLQDYLGA
jgi:thiamine transport system ATP-binding protein